MSADKYTQLEEALGSLPEGFSYEKESMMGPYHIYNQKTISCLKIDTTCTFSRYVVTFQGVLSNKSKQGYENPKNIINDLLLSIPFKNKESLLVPQVIPTIKITEKSPSLSERIQTHEFLGIKTRKRHPNQ